MVAPYYCLTRECVDEAGAILQTTERDLEAGDSYVLIEPVIKDYFLKAVEGDIDVLKAIDRHFTLRLVYTDKEDTGIEHPVVYQEGKVYRLNGTPVEMLTEKELYILNGKKIIKK